MKKAKPAPKRKSRPAPAASDSAVNDVARSAQIAKKLSNAARNEDPAHVAGAIAMLAAETIQRSSKSLMEARSYLEGLHAGIDGLLRHAFPEKE
jgi:hypothetical protein